MNQEVRSATHTARDSLAKTPHFPKTISCLAGIMGEPRRSGHNPGLDEIGKKRTFPNKFRESPTWRFRPQNRVHSGLIRTSFNQISGPQTLPPRFPSHKMLVKPRFFGTISGISVQQSCFRSRLDFSHFFC